MLETHFKWFCAFCNHILNKCVGPGSDKSSLAGATVCDAQTYPPFFGGFIASIINGKWFCRRCCGCCRILSKGVRSFYVLAYESVDRRIMLVEGPVQGEIFERTENAGEKTREEHHYLQEGKSKLYGLWSRRLYLQASKLWCVRH